MLEFRSYSIMFRLPVFVFEEKYCNIKSLCVIDAFCGVILYETNHKKTDYHCKICAV